MKILYVTPRFAPLAGGTETHVREVGRRLAAHHEVHVLTCDPGLGLPPTERIDGMEIERVPAWPRGGDYYFAPSLPGRIAEIAPDIVHVQNYHTFVAPMAMTAARRAGIPYVLTFHSGGHSSRLRRSIRGLQLLALRPLLMGASALVSVSAFEREWLRRSLHLSRARFALVPNGSDLSPDGGGALPAAAAEDADAAPGDDPLILAVGRLERYKGHQRVIDALPRVLREYPRARLRIAGWGPNADALQSRAASLGVQERVEIAGVPPEDRRAMIALLLQASVVALLSDYEAHPIAALEASALGRPLVVSGAGAFDSFVDRGMALRASENDPDAVADAVLSCLRGEFLPAERPELWTWDRTTGALLALYENVLRESA